MKVVEANLDHWEAILELLVLIESSEYKEFQNARKSIDFNRRTLEAYLVQSLTNRDFMFYLCLNDAGEVLGFTVFHKTQMVDFKNPKKGPVPVGFIITQFSTEGAMEHMVPKLKAFAIANGLAYYYANVSLKGALKHYLEYYGATELSRTLYLETEKLDG